MSESKELKSICSDLAEKVADDNGFVNILKLLERFRAQLLIRPLLVEAAIGKNTESEGDWLVLVDEETYGQPTGDDKFASPWNARMRFSIAHELTHTVAFHSKEFGFQFSMAKRKGESDQEFLLRIEKQTDSATPFLLLTRRAFSFFVKDVTVENLRKFCRNFGVSSNVLISFLNHLSPIDDQDIFKNLQNVSIGLIHKGRFLENPVFSHFDDNLVPELIRDFRLKKSVMISDLGDPDSNGELGISMRLGTYQFPGTEEHEFILKIESGDGNRFFILKPGKASQSSFDFTRSAEISAGDA